MMELISTVWTWLITLDKAPFAILLTFLSYYILQERIKTFTKEHELRKRYNAKIFAKMEEVLKSVVHRNYEYMYNALKGEKKDCPKGELDCHSANTSIPSQLHTYHLVLRDVFMTTIHNSIKNLIFDNGYHSMSDAELTEYCREHSVNLFNEAIAEIRIHCGDRLPDIVKNFGSAYLPEDAYIDFTKIIKHCIQQHKIRDHKISQLRKGFWTKLKSLKGVIDVK